MRPQERLTYRMSPLLPDGDRAFTAHVAFDLRPTGTGTQLDAHWRIEGSTVEAADFIAGFEAYAARMNSMPKYVASRSLTGPLEWNATLLDDDLATTMSRLKDEHDGNLIVPCAGKLARDLIAHELVDEFWFHVSPYLWATGPRIFDDIGPLRLELVNTTTFPSGVVRLCYQSAPADMPATK